MAKKFIFKQNQIIGAAAAESDEHFLSQCFVDNGSIDIIRHCNDPRHILIGRTGSGKSAIIRRLVDYEDHVINIRPESLSLSYIANSNILNFFTEAGVKMDIFYRLLWRHVFCVELLKERFQINTEEKKKKFLDIIWSITSNNKSNENALEYLKKWGESFWQETEYRIKEVTTILEKELKASVDGNIPGIANLSGTAGRKLTEEQKEDVIHRAQEVVNKVQIRELSTVMDMMNDILLSNQQQKFFITIDKLDEDWIEDNLRFRLIRALIETSVDFFDRVKCVKIIIAIRSDLLDRIYRYTRDPGFQEEKYRTSSLDLSWTKKDLIEVLNTRIQLLVKEQYTNYQVTYKDLIVEKIGKQEAIDYILERTLMRPRDIINFFNTAIRLSDGKPTINKKAILEAEGIYSRERLRALYDEWFGLYPNLDNFTTLLQGRGQPFRLIDISNEELTENYLRLLISPQAHQGIDNDFAKMLFEGQIDIDTYRRNIVQILYKVGLIGLRTGSNLPISWSHISGAGVSLSEISNDTRIYIHPIFNRVFAIPLDIDIETI